MRVRLLCLFGWALATFGAAAQTGCPFAPATPGVLLTVLGPDATRVDFDASRLAALPTQERVQRRSVSAGASAPGVEQELRYAGVLLRDVIAHALPDTLRARDARRLVFEAIATDRYVGVFSWGELFNAPAGDQVLVVTSQDGRALGAEAGPLALRALGDLRPGPRHVRNLCAIVARLATGS